MPYNLNELLNYDTKRLDDCLLKITDPAYGGNRVYDRYTALLALYFMKTCQGKEYDAIEETPELTAEQKSNCCMLIAEHNNYLSGIADVFDLKDIMAAAVQNPVSVREVLGATPFGLCALAYKLLDPQDGTKMADLTSGVGNMMIYANEQKFHGLDCVDISSASQSIARSKAVILNCSADFVTEDMLRYSEFNDWNTKNNNWYKYIFADLPLGQRLRGEPYDQFRRVLGSHLNVDAERVTDEWLYALKILDLLEYGGTAVIYGATGMCFRTGSQKLREELLRRGWIKTVITLSDKVRGSTSIRPCLIVLQKTPGTEVRIVDAAEIYTQKKKWRKSISFHNADQIVELSKQDSENSKLVSVDEILNAHANLDPMVYLHKSEIPEGAVPLESVSERINRNPMTGRELEKYASPDGDFITISPTNIQDGLLELPKEMELYSDLPEKVNPYILEYGDILINRNGGYAKTAVFDAELEQKAVIDGSLILVRPDKEKVDPWFLQAYFESEGGKKALENLYVGITVKSLQPKALEKLMVPCPPMDEQKEITNKYKEACSSLKEASRLLEKARFLKSHIYK